MIVYIVTQIHRGVIWKTAVFENFDDARDYKYELEFDLVDHEPLLSDDDSVDLQECEIIERKYEQIRC